MPPGRYHIDVALPAASAAAFLPPPPCDIDLGASETLAVTVEVEPFAEIIATVRSAADRQPIAGCRVTAIDGAGGSAAETVTDAKGQARLPGLRRGEYSLQVEPQGDAATLVQPPAVVAGVALAAGKHRQIEIEAPPLGILPVQVRRAARPATDRRPAEAARPLPGATVRLRPAQGEPLVVTADGTGRARFTGIVPGRYRLEAEVGSGPPRLSPFGTDVSVEGGQNAEQVADLDTTSCRLGAVTIHEFVAENPAAVSKVAGTEGARPRRRTGFTRKPKRVFRLGPGGGAPAAGEIEVAQDGIIDLVAPRFDDLFSAAPAVAATPVFDPPGSAFHSWIKPTWLEVRTDATPHPAAPEATEPDHPEIVLANGVRQRVVDAKGLAAPGQALVWGPALPLALGATPQSGGWFTGVGRYLGQVLSAFTMERQGPATWDVWVKHCDEDGRDDVRHAVLRLWPGDEYELAVKIPRFGSAEYGVRGEYVDGKYAKQTDDLEASGFKSGEIAQTAPDEEAEATDQSSQLAPGRVFQPKFTEQELIDLTRNGHQDPAVEAVQTLVNLIANGARDGVEFFTTLSNLTPKFGWWFSVDMSFLAIELNGRRAYQVVEDGGRALNRVAPAWEVAIKGKLFELTLDLRAGIEIGGTATVVMVRGVVFLGFTIGLEVNGSWKQVGGANHGDRDGNFESKASLQAGIDIIIGHPNLCSLKGWTKVPYTVRATVGPPNEADDNAGGAAAPQAGTQDANEAPADRNGSKDWKVHFRHGCADGIYLECKGKLFFKFSTHKRVELKKPVPLEG
ncbi:MAG: collagen binding domain-containing protein [Gemmatimonadales bacterium]